MVEAKSIFPGEVAEVIQEAVGQVLKKVGVETKGGEINLEHPALDAHGDYATNVVLMMFSQLKGGKSLKSHEIEKIWGPKNLADYMVDLLMKDETLMKVVEKVEVAGPGFINFWLKREYLVKELEKIVKERDEYGNSKSMESKKVMVEFAHPNTHKELHIGHMRTLTTGEALSRILEAVGAEVFRANYQGDIGPHVAKAIWGTRKLLEEKGLDWEDAEKFSLEEKAHLLGSGYVKGNQEYDKYKGEINKTNIELYKKDKEILPIYERTRRWSLEYYDEFYKRFGTKFDKLYFESKVADKGKEIVLDNVGEVFEESDGAVIFNGEKYGLHKRVFLTAEGYPTYEAKDMELAPMQFSDFPFDVNIHVVANEQAGYFQVVFKALELIDKKFENREFHLSMGMVNLVGMKMSSRTGVLVTVEDLLNQVKESLRPLVKQEKLSGEEIEEIVEKVTIGAVKYWMLKVNPTMNVAFDVKKSVDLQGDSGPYLQYTYARTQSVLAKAKVVVGEILRHPQTSHGLRSAQDDKTDLESLSVLSNVNAEELSVLRWIYRFPEVVMQAAVEYVPNHICSYLHELAQRYNTFYNRHRILNADTEEEIQMRLLMTTATGQVIKNGLRLLGIEAPDRM